MAFSSQTKATDRAVMLSNVSKLRRFQKQRVQFFEQFGQHGHPGAFGRFAHSKTMRSSAFLAAPWASS
jgi:hypothetical protein